MINIKAVCRTFFLCVSLLGSSYASNLFDSAKSLGSLDKLKEKLSKEVASGKSSMGEYANKSLGNALGGIDLSSILSGSQEGFKTDVSNGVSNVVKSSLDYSKSFTSPQLASVVENLTPFIQNTINTSVGSFNMGEAATSLFKSEFFQKNIIGYLSTFISGNMQNGGIPAVDSSLVQSLSQSFLKSPSFLESVTSLASQKLLSPPENQATVQADVVKQIDSTTVSPIANTKGPEKVVTEVVEKDQDHVKQVDQPQEKSTGWVSYIKSLLGY